MQDTWVPSLDRSTRFRVLDRHLSGRRVNSYYTTSRSHGLFPLVGHNCRRFLGRVLIIHHSVVVAHGQCRSGRRLNVDDVLAPFHPRRRNHLQTVIVRLRVQCRHFKTQIYQ